MFPVFHLVWSTCRNKNICCVLKKVVAKSRARVYFEQQILVLLLVFHQTHNLSRNKFARALANQPISAPHFFNPQQMFLWRVKLLTHSEKTSGNIDENLQRNNVARQVEGFCISHFAAFSTVLYATHVHSCDSCRLTFHDLWRNHCKQVYYFTGSKSVFQPKRKFSFAVPFSEVSEVTEKTLNASQIYFGFLFLEVL